MDKIMTARFDRVDKALNTLIDSISKYNPSVYQGSELVAADAELSKSLEELHVHQQNYARIQELQRISDVLDGQIKDTLTQLAQVRKELKDTPATVFPSGPSYPINYEELLAFARRISKTTLPHQSVLAAASGAAAAAAPNSTSPAATDSVPKPDSGTGSAAPTPGGTPNGASTPSAAAGSGASMPAQSGELAPAGSQQMNSNTALPENITAHLNPHAGVDFVPWPSEDNLRSGALAQLAYLTNRGIEPEGYDPAAEEARKKREEEEAREREEKERVEREERERRAREQRERERLQREKDMEEFRRGSVSQGGPAGVSGLPPLPTPQGKQQKQFQFMGGDDDDDDSD
jgi:hypothetical protein